ncbi:sulfurase [Loktanella sp. 5RATIMAR09]|uniref:MOSC domain-containing protein n=1 Tax=Loktanella sp. 5RATIMAR09 TaxID=1225655 RepID=UPI0006EB2EFA|nr:MOSC domain-containing protein [Loktanella sp. 5RATIMAR09]KQI73321.1 sulfurase [Loktanella sp. 5RATIMAR09]
MMARHARVGRLDWIGLRAARYDPLDVVQSAEITEAGLLGDHGRAGKRAVTLMQAEHLPVIAALSNRSEILPEVLRRNLVVSGLNLLALRKGVLRIGDVILEVEGPCPPCSRMEKALGPGGYNAMRGHGGWYASVVKPGTVCVGDAVEPASPERH